MSRCWAIIAGGGTAGHVVPAIAIGRALVERGHPPETIHFVGSKRGIDGRLVPAAGFPLTLLPGRGLARKLTLDNLQSLFGFAAGLVLAIVLVLRKRPAVVVSMGGYAAAPCALAAALFRIPLVLSEQNAVPTATHRLVARFAAASAVPYEGTPLPRPVVTGNPVRPEILAVDPSPAGRKAARRSLGLPDDDDTVVLAAVGGSLGARTINAAVLDLVGRWDGPPLAVRHAVGERDWAWAQANTPSPAPGVVAYQPVPYEDRMAELLAACDIVVARSGGSVAELAVVGRAGILVPLPIAPYDHQAHNAQQLVRAGAAIMLRDPELTGERLDAELRQLLAGGPSRVRSMGEAARAVGRPDAAGAVADVVEAHARRGSA
ncbi:MAG TPA: UDP-N-acetylglucosamine--N-acetylmuramyl-(pentapeptide) pyrophosphoryl-undecaprenol N-acetylglucosamine transferase [Acidimicrobiales bacterium]|nr:UDP-N-acetylglucosamine--N-acetylmuramyl-(pentapeptide) pyrophosphoryl-undecaprenol N-acetylglucosamine transferase [Acidimicrobiales bacterium]